jgi:hypothetical protein
MSVTAHGEVDVAVSGQGLRHLRMHATVSQIRQEGVSQGVEDATF